MNDKYVTCQMCGQAVTEDRAYQRVVGWERKRSAGGTNTVALREPLQEWACTSCVDLLKHGISVNQGTIFDG